LQRALEKARRAVRLDPANMRASQALMTALFYDQKLDEALRIGEEALARNPNDTEFLGEYGLRLSQAGFWERGEELIEQAIERNPSSATMYDTGLALSAYMMGDTERAVRLIRKADTPRFPFYYAISALIYANADMKPEAAAARERFMAAWPGFFDDLDGELAKRLYDPGDRAKIVEDSRKAGFPVPLPRAEMPPAD
jgi:tetratricopeptide (TPR) repeat protein